MYGCTYSEERFCCWKTQFKQIQFRPKCFHHSYCIRSHFITSGLQQDICKGLPKEKKKKTFVKGFIKNEIWKHQFKKFWFICSERMFDARPMLNRRKLRNGTYKTSTLHEIFKLLSMKEQLHTCKLQPVTTKASSYLQQNTIFQCIRSVGLPWIMEPKKYSIWPISFSFSDLLSSFILLGLDQPKQNVD